MRLISAIIGVALLGVAGCASTAPGQNADAVSLSAGPGSGGGYAPGLLFDRIPSRYQASDFAYRSSWPSTDAFYSPGQVIFFSERFIDVQGRTFDGPDYTYRRFETYRGGYGYR